MTMVVLTHLLQSKWTIVMAPIPKLLLALFPASIESKSRLLVNRSLESPFSFVAKKGHISAKNCSAEGTPINTHLTSASPTTHTPQHITSHHTTPQTQHHQCLFSFYSLILILYWLARYHHSIHLAHYNHLHSLPSSQLTLLH